ncbi:MAG TPA: AMP-binding protein, partial [Thermoanaerobaculia bacterium]
MPENAGNPETAAWAPAAPTAHRDTFCRDHLPPREMWPRMDYSVLPELAYPDRLNCAVELLDRAVAAGHGERVALHFPGGRWTYRELLQTANRIAHALTDDLGLVPGERVLLRSPNTPMLAACWFAVLKAGGIVVCTMPLLRVRELVYIADKAKIRLALTDHRVAAEAEQAMAATAAGTRREGARVVPFHPHALPELGRGSLEALAAAKPEVHQAVDTAADDPAILAFTSGTTGQGKGTVHFHRDILAASDCFPRFILKPDRDDVFCGSPPFAFTYGLGGVLLFPLRYHAATLLLEQASPPHLIKGIAEHRATVVFTAPTAYRAMLPLVPQHDLSCLKKCVSAGETLPAGTFEAWRAATGLSIIDGIGSTEMLHMFIAAEGDDIKPGATGKPIPGYEAKLVDEEGRDLPLGATGRLAVRGPTGCRYLDNLERQAAYVQNGWNLTGDSYRTDLDGYFWYQARTDDMILSSGHNIAGPEVENVLLEHPKVQECGVVGVPDEERGQIVKAFVVLRPDVMPCIEVAKELQEFVKAEIAPYKYPRAIEFAQALPRTATGKLQRFRLRE